VVARTSPRLKAGGDIQELLRFTLLLRPQAVALSDRYSERNADAGRIEAFAA
jgi:hypothetical protein